MIVRLFPEEKVLRKKKLKENMNFVLELVSFPAHTPAKKKREAGLVLLGNYIKPSRSR